MSAIKTMSKRHPVLTYYALAFAISLGSFLVVLGPQAFLGTKQTPEALLIG